MPLNQKIRICAVYNLIFFQVIIMKFGTLTSIDAFYLLQGPQFTNFCCVSTFYRKHPQKTHTALSFGLFKAYIKYLIEVELDTSHAKSQPRNAKLSRKK